MSLANIVKGKLEKPDRILLVGVEGVGKSTFGAAAPDPVFLGAEDGTAQLDVQRMGPRDEQGNAQPMRWGDIRDAVRLLTTAPHAFKTLVVDTVDWAEPLLWDHICQRDSKKNIEDYGFGKGYSAALDEWRSFLSDLERMREQRKMHVILLAHAWIKPFKNPEGEDYDRYELKLNNKAAGLLKEWSDAVLFANFETLVNEDERTKRNKGVSTGKRLLFTERRAAFDAKNRFGLPFVMPLSWAEYFARAHQGLDPATLRAEIEQKAQQLDEKTKADALGVLSRAKDEVAKLVQAKNWIDGKLAERAA
jgi:hypothetical protein